MTFSDERNWQEKRKARFSIISLFKVNDSKIFISIVEIIKFISSFVLRLSLAITFSLRKFLLSRASICHQFYIFQRGYLTPKPFQRLVTRLSLLNPPSISMELATDVVRTQLSCKRTKVELIIVNKTVVEKGFAVYT